MVPSDGKFFFANDVMRGLGSPTAGSQMDVEDSAPPLQKSQGR
jgi:hypothetical protein